VRGWGHCFPRLSIFAAAKNILVVRHNLVLLLSQKNKKMEIFLTQKATCTNNYFTMKGKANYKKDHK